MSLTKPVTEDIRQNGVAQHRAPDLGSRSVLSDTW